MPEPLPFDPTRPLVGIDLRHAALFVLDRWGAVSIGESIEALANRGFTVFGEKPRKVLSDALRHEVRRGRARRVGWGRYAIAHLARTTRWRITRRWIAARPTATDVYGNPVPPGAPIRSGESVIPWSLHDRRWPESWNDRNRTRWKIGARIQRKQLAHQRAERARAARLKHLQIPLIE